MPERREDRPGEPSNERKRSNLFTLQELRNYASDLITRKGFGISEANAIAGYSNPHSFYRARKAEGFLGLRQIMKVLECLGYRVEMYIQVVDTCPIANRRETLDPDLKINELSSEKQRRLRRMRRLEQLMSTD